MWIAELGWDDVTVAGATVRGKACITRVWLGRGDSIVGRSTRASKQAGGQCVVGWDPDPARASALSRMCLVLTVEPGGSDGEACQLQVSAVGQQQYWLERKAGGQAVLLVRAGANRAGERVAVAAGDRVRVGSGGAFVRFAWRPLVLALHSELTKDAAERARAEAAIAKLSSWTLSKVQVVKGIIGTTTHLIMVSRPSRMSTSLVDALSFCVPVANVAFLEDSFNHIESHKAEIDLSDPQLGQAYVPKTAGLMRSLSLAVGRVQSQSQRSNAASMVQSQRSLGIDPGPNFAVDLGVRPSRKELLKGKVVVAVDKSSRSSFGKVLRGLGAEAAVQVELGDADKQAASAAHLEQQFGRDGDKVVVLFENVNKPPLPCWGGFLGLDAVALSRALFGNHKPTDVPYQRIPVREQEQEQEQELDLFDTNHPMTLEAAQEPAGGGDDQLAPSQGAENKVASSQGSSGTESEEDVITPKPKPAAQESKANVPKPKRRARSPPPKLTPQVKKAKKTAAPSSPSPAPAPESPVVAAPSPEPAPSREPAPRTARDKESKRSKKQAVSSPPPPADAVVSDNDDEYVPGADEAMDDDHDYDLDEEAVVKKPKQKSGKRPNKQAQLRASCTEPVMWSTNRGDLEDDERDRILKVLMDAAKRRKRREKALQQQADRLPASTTKLGGLAPRRFRRGRHPVQRASDLNIKWVKSVGLTDEQLAELNKRDPKDQRDEEEEDRDMFFAAAASNKNKAAGRRTLKKRA